nr:hypothetical protein [Tanacetum cinerariifolium]
MTTDTLTSNQNLNLTTTNPHSSNQKESSPDEFQETMIRKGVRLTPIENNHKSYTRVTNHTHTHLSTPAISSLILNCADDTQTTPSSSKVAEVAERMANDFSL